MDASLSSRMNRSKYLMEESLMMGRLIIGIQSLGDEFILEGEPNVQLEAESNRSGSRSD
jgi:hypothetical protein